MEENKPRSIGVGVIPEAIRRHKEALRSGDPKQCGFALNELKNQIALLIEGLGGASETQLCTEIETGKKYLKQQTQ